MIQVHFINAQREEKSSASRKMARINMYTFSATAFVYATPIPIEPSFTSFFFCPKNTAVPLQSHHSLLLHIWKMPLWTNPLSSAKNRRKIIMKAFTELVFICPISILPRVKQSDRWCVGNNDALVIWWIERHQVWNGICNVPFRWLPLTVLRQFCISHMPLIYVLDFTYFCSYFLWEF